VTRTISPGSNRIFGFGFFHALLHALQDGVSLAVLDRQWAIGSATDETHDLGCFLDQVPAVVVDVRGFAGAIGFDLHQHVTREELAVAAALLAAAHLQHLFGRHQYLTEFSPPHRHDECAPRALS